jgi:ribosome-binding ATPase YchF (GTP1/OBG family)
VKAALEAETPARSASLSEEEEKEVKKLTLLTMKKMLYVLNVRSGGANLDELEDERFERLLAFFEEEGASYVIVDAALESELNSVADEDRKAMRESFKVRGGIDNLIVAGYDLLSLITFFTTGEDETRAWTVTRGAKAPEAGATIHTDFSDKFIRAEVVFWKDLVDAGGYAGARTKGLVRTEGKGYVVKDGDVMEFKI